MSNPASKPMGAQPAFNPNYLSKSGAFNGTGIAIASYSFDKGGYGVINVYYQHHNSQIRKIQLNDDGTWFGGDATTIIATDAKNGTPISAVAYAMDNTSKVRIYSCVKGCKNRWRVVLNALSVPERSTMEESGRKQAVSKTLLSLWIRYSSFQLYSLHRS